MLIIDALHYMAPEEQRALLQRAARALRPGGRLVIRELDPSRGFRSRIAQWAERVGSRAGMNRGAIREWVDPAALSAEIEGLGLSPRLVLDPDDRPSPNYLLVADKA